LKGNLWGADAPSEDRILDALVYRSRLIGTDPDLVVWGGGNTSAKTLESDFRGRRREVLRIKGSGTDLKSIGRDGFPGIFRDDVLTLLKRGEMSDEEMVAYLEHCMVEPGGRRPSIETLLHAFLPARHVDHVHADAIVILTNTPHGNRIVREVLGDDIAFVPYRRPGFQLSKQVYAAAEGHTGVVLEKHGLVTWGDTAQESYNRTIELVERADAYLRHKVQRGTRVDSATRSPADTSDLLLRLRGRLGHVILRTETGPEYRAISDRGDVQAIAAAGPATADHVLRIRPWSCVLDDADIDGAVGAYEARYRAFFARYSTEGLPMLDPLPKVFLVPGLGLISAGKDAQDARVTAEVALHTLRVAAAGTDAHEAYESLVEEDLFHVDYWPLELYKLTTAPPPREFAGRIMLVTGAASGIGRAVARHLARLGAQTVLLDIQADGLERTAEQIVEAGGFEPLPLPVDLTDADATAAAVQCAIHTYGGVDALVSNAGIPATGMLSEVSPESFRRSLEVNTTSHFIISAEVMRAMNMSGLGGSIVYVASKNAFGPGAGFGPYSVAKAGQVQLARVMALEGGASGIRSNIVNPDAIFEDSGLWSDQVRRERAAAHGVPVEQLEQFYAGRNLLRARITGHDVAEAVGFLLSDRARATTGTVIAVDGGVASAFSR
jgi:rhamnulose-1-phosphate aldolase/alcohol dehydrogenase